MKYWANQPCGKHDYALYTHFPANRQMMWAKIWSFFLTTPTANAGGPSRSVSNGSIWDILIFSKKSNRGAYIFRAQKQGRHATPWQNAGLVSSAENAPILYNTHILPMGKLHCEI